MIKARENPFRSQCVERLAFRPTGTTWDQLLKRLEAMRRRAAVVGPEGVGKTTLLEQLARQLEQGGERVQLWRVSGNEPLPSVRDVVRWADAPGCMLIFDGADHLPWWSWQLLKRRSMRAAGLVISSHRAGMLPTLIENRADAALVRELVIELVGRDAAASIADQLPALLERHDGNVRLVLRELYDRWEEFR